MLAGMSGVPRVCGTHSIAICGCGSSSAFVSTGGSPSARSSASIASTGPPRRISVERRQARLNCAVVCAGPRERPLASNAA